MTFHGLSTQAIANVEIGQTVATVRLLNDTYNSSNFHHI